MRFCHEYLKDFNGKKAAIRTGFSEKTAKVIASKLLAKVNIQQEIQRLSDDFLRRCDVTTEKLISEYAKIAFFNLHEILDSKGRLPTSPEDMNNIAACVIKRIKVSTDKNKHNVVDIEFWDKQKAQDKLGEYKNMFVQQHKVEQAGEWKITINKTYDPNDYIKKHNNNNGSNNSNA